MFQIIVIFSNAFKKYLSLLAEKLGGESSIVFIIDELDRCKPKFALSLIESIKHLFCVPNITFVLVMNRKQLEEAVRCEYGHGVDAARYLQKFVSVWTTLPKPEDRHLPKKYLQYCLSRMEYAAKTTPQKLTIKFFEYIASYYDLSLREIEKSLTSFAMIYNATDGDLTKDDSWLSVFVSVIKTTKPDVYRKLSRNSITYNELLADLKVDRWRKSEGHPIRWMLKYYLSTDEEAQALFQKGNYSLHSSFDRNAVKTICACLEAFKHGLK